MRVYHYGFFFYVSNFILQLTTVYYLTMTGKKNNMVRK